MSSSQDQPTTRSPELQGDTRYQEIKQFLICCGFSTTVGITPLAQDASFRRYFRICDNDHRSKSGSIADTAAAQSFIVMDAPPDKESVTPFISILNHLQKLGLRPPRLLHADVPLGLLLLEDLGVSTYTRLLNDGANADTLYRGAVNVLAALHNHEQALAVNVPNYDIDRLIAESLLFTDWYLPAITGHSLSDRARNQWRDAWQTTLNALPIMPPTLVLRDFHVDNLMQINDRLHTVCALLDFQDAVVGSPAYDLVSLLEDARRDLEPSLIHDMRQHYDDACPKYNSEHFDNWFHVLGAQRHAKVLGIFMRLWIRDDKPIYLDHIPRVTRLFSAKLSDPNLAPVAEWVSANVPSLPAQLPPVDLQKTRELVGAKQ